MKTEPNTKVVDWLNQQPTNQLFLSSITLAEISFGLIVLPDGNRKERLRLSFERFINIGFVNRILSFDASSSNAFAQVMLKRKQMGRPMSFQDGQIAAIALQHKLSLATRNTKDFEFIGITIINPFEI
jgi:predicted nucleic acid-binding protein